MSGSSHPDMASGIQSSNGLYNTKKLNGTSNYEMWMTDMRTELCREDVWGIVDGSEPRPTLVSQTDSTTAEYDKLLEDFSLKKVEWNRKNQKARICLVLCLSEAPRKEVQALDDSAEIWARLKKLYQPKGTGQRYTSFVALMEAKREHHGSIEAYKSHMAEHAKVCAHVGSPIPDWVMDSLVRHGLPDNYRGSTGYEPSKT